jgi:hypothetical protein
MKQDITPKQISSKKFKDEMIPIILEKLETLQHNVGDLHNKIGSAVGLKKESREPYTYNPFNKFKLNYYEDGLFFDNIFIQFDIDFLSIIKESPIIKDELYLSNDMVFFATCEESASSEFYIRNFSKYGHPTIKELFKRFDSLQEVMGDLHNEEKGSYVINNLNYFKLIDSIDKFNSFCLSVTKEDLISNNNIEMIYESYLNESNSNSGLTSTIIYNLHKLRTDQISRFKIEIHTESYEFQSYIKLYIWSELQKQWNILLVPKFKQFGISPTSYTSNSKPSVNFTNQIIKFCMEFSQNFI